MGISLPFAVSAGFLIESVTKEGLSIHICSVKRAEGGLAFEAREAAFHVRGGATDVDFVTASHAVEHHFRLVLLVVRVVVFVGL